MRDRLRDFTANLLSRVGRGVEVESKLQPLTGEIMVRSANTDDNARLDVKARRFIEPVSEHFLIFKSRM